VLKESYPLSRDELYEELKKNNINARRYFSPLISEFERYSVKKSKKEHQLENAKMISSNVICLPFYPDLDLSTMDRVVRIISEFKCKAI